MVTYWKISVFLSLCLSLRQTLASDRPSSDVCEDLHDNLRQCEHVDVCIPSDIVIGPFLVTTESARQTLCSKYQALVSVTLELYAQNLKQQANEVISTTSDLRDDVKAGFTPGL